MYSFVNQAAVHTLLIFIWSEKGGEGEAERGRGGGSCEFSIGFSIFKC